MSDRKKEQAVERALTEGYEKYYRLAYSYVHNEADALDIVQEAAYKAILKSDSLKEPQYVETWDRDQRGVQLPAQPEGERGCGGDPGGK